MANTPANGKEWITVVTLIGCYCTFAIATAYLPLLSLPAAMFVTSIVIALHSSLQHEMLHGHPTRNKMFNELLVFPTIGLLVPYGRFRDLHIAHHQDEILTDPYDDPESNFFDPKIWSEIHAWRQWIYRINNTLLGRIILGPALSIVCLIGGDIRSILRGEQGVLKSWILHALGLIPVVWWLTNIATLPLWVYFIAAYFGFGWLKIRTYLEHRAFDEASGRTVIIEDRGPLALLFLNNNYHIVHHTHPGEAWYNMQKIYYADPERYQKLNNGYIYRNYAEIFWKYLLRAKDPVPHPLMD